MKKILLLTIVGLFLLINAWSDDIDIKEIMIDHSMEFDRAYVSTAMMMFADKLIEHKINLIFIPPFNNDYSKEPLITAVYPEGSSIFKVVDSICRKSGLKYIMEKNTLIVGKRLPSDDKHLSYLKPFEHIVIEGIKLPVPKEVPSDEQPSKAEQELAEIDPEFKKELERLYKNRTMTIYEHFPIIEKLSRKYDKNGEGVKFVIAKDVPIDNLPKVRMQNVSLCQLISLICRCADLSYKVDGNKVAISRRVNSSNTSDPTIDGKNVAWVEIDIYLSANSQKIKAVRENTTVFINGFFISPLNSTAIFFQKGKNQFQIILSENSFPRPLRTGDVLKIEIKNSDNVIIEHEIQYTADTKSFLWDFDIKEISFKTQWNDAKSFQKLSSADKLEIKKIVDEVISLYSQENLDEIYNFEQKYRRIRYEDIASTTGRPITPWPKSVFKLLFTGEDRFSFRSNSNFSIKLNPSNNKVINVIPDGGNPLYEIKSTSHHLIDGAKSHLRWEAYGLNIINIDNEWQIY